MNTTRKAGWLATATLLGAALIAPSAALAITGHQDFPIAWNASGFDDEECAEIKLAPGQVYWHFVQTQTDVTDPADALLNIDIAGTDSDVVGLAAYKVAGGVVHWEATTPQITLDGISSNIDGDGNLNISHICVGPEEESASPSDEVQSEAPSDEVQSEAPSDEVQSEAPSDEVQSEAPSPPDGPKGSVDAETGTPEVTPPSTDSIAGGGTTSSPSSNGWQLILVGLAVLTATALIVTPSGKRR
jgi:hypothetical protein